MAQAWTAPAYTDLWQIVSRKVVLKVEEDSAGGADATNDFDSSLDTRAKEAGGRYPVSATAGTVPPEGVRHTLVMAAYALCRPVPSLLAVLMNEGGGFSPMGKLYTDACKWVDMLRTGGSFTMPDDPAGADYSTEVGDGNPAVTAVIWGDSTADGDEYDAGVTD